MVGAFAQSLQENLANLEFYQEKLPFFQELITGAQYPEPPKNHEGFPFLKGRSFEYGGLTINQVYYPDIPLLYDIRYDQVITVHPIYMQKLLINPAKINSFRLGDGSNFEQLTGNESYAHHKNGFYEIVEEGSVTLLAKHYKIPKPTRELGDYVAKYEEFEDFFIWDGSQFFSIKTKKSAIKTLELSKKLVRENLTRKGIYYGSNKRRYLKMLIQIHSQSRGTENE